MGAITTYKHKSNWVLKTGKGVTGGVGFFKFLSAGVQNIDLVAQRISNNIVVEEQVKLKMSVSGFDIGKSIGVDVVEAVTGISASIVTESKKTPPIYINSKFGTYLTASDLIGPCNLISIDAGKVNLVKEVKKYMGSTFLFLGWGGAVMDKSADWFENMLNKLENGDTWGSYNKKYVENHGLLSNAKAVCRVDINGLEASAKVDNKISLYSGQIVRA